MGELCVSYGPVRRYRFRYEFISFYKRLSCLRVDRSVVEFFDKSASDSAARQTLLGSRIMSRKRRVRRMSRRGTDRLFLGTGQSGPNRPWAFPPHIFQGSTGTRGGHTSRSLRVEQLENRIVLSTIASAELFAPFCTPLDVNVAAAVQPSVSVSSTAVYGPLQDNGLEFVTSAGSGDSSIQKSSPSVDHLQAPDMPGLSELSSNIAGAMIDAWDIPADSMTDSWVVGLAEGQGPESLQPLGFEVASPAA